MPRRESQSAGHRRRRPLLGRGAACAAVAALLAVGLVGCASDPSSPPAPRTAKKDGLIWRGDFETGNFSQFRVLKHNFEGAPEPVLSTNAREGRFAARFEIGEGGKRTELRVPARYAFDEGDERWFAFSTYLEPGFPTDTSWCVLAQWKNDGEGSPPFALAVEKETREFSFTGGAGHPDGSRYHVRLAGPVVTGRWIDWIVHAKFSSDPAVGYYEVWRDGRLVIPRYHPRGGTLYPGLKSYVKIGLYRDTAITKEAAVLDDDWRSGLTRSAVTGEPRR